jgi:hypothetical protein
VEGEAAYVGVGTGTGVEGEAAYVGVGTGTGVEGEAAYVGVGTGTGVEVSRKNVSRKNVDVVLRRRRLKHSRRVLVKAERKLWFYLVWATEVEAESSSLLAEATKRVGLEQGSTVPSTAAEKGRGASLLVTPPGVAGSTSGPFGPGPGAVQELAGGTGPGAVSDRSAQLERRGEAGGGVGWDMDGLD